MSKALQEKIKKVGSLLAGSMLAEDVKKVIVKNAKHLREVDIDALLDVLTKEKLALSELEEMAKRFSEDSKEEWKKTVEFQGNMVKAWLEESREALMKAE